MAVIVRFLLVGCIVFLLPAAGCSREPAGKMVVQAPVAPAAAPLLVMHEDRWSPGRGMEMELIIYKSVEEATARIISGEADLTILPVNVAAKLYNKGIPVSLANISTWGLLYLVTEDPEVNKLADLRGRELYVGARGATPDVLTRYLLFKNGVGERDVDLKYAQSPEIARMMVAGLARTAVLPEPLATQVITKNPSMRVAADFYREWQLVEGEGAGLPQAGMVVINSFLKKNPRAFDAFQGAYRKSLDEAALSPERAAPLVEKHLGISREVFIASAGRVRMKFAGARQARVDVENYLSRLKDFSPEEVGGKVPDDGFFVQR